MRYSEVSLYLDIAKFWSFLLYFIGVYSRGHANVKVPVSVCRLVCLHAYPTSLFCIFELFEGRKIKLTDRLTNTATYRVACTRSALLEQKFLQFLKMDHNSFYLIEHASDVSKITLSVVVSAYCLIWIKHQSSLTKKNQMISKALTFFKNPLLILLPFFVIRMLPYNL